jgi:hypothetical protein
MEENKVLKELHGNKRLNFTNEQRKRLARKGRKLGLNGLRKVTTLVTPETILAWHRKLVVLKYTAKKRILTPAQEPGGSATDGRADRPRESDLGIFAHCRGPPESGREAFEDHDCQYPPEGLMEIQIEKV